jgi:ERCC4-type nuclease
MIKALGSCAIPCPLFTDCGFWGVGDNGETLLVGVERKKVGDLCQCINDGRLMHQAQVAKENGIDVFCVIVEGRIRSNPDDGLLEVPVWKPYVNVAGFHKQREEWVPVKPTMTYSRLVQFLYELTYLADIQVLRTENVTETASAIRALWDFHQKRPDEHQSLHKIFKRPPPTVNLVRPSLIRRISSELEGIGWEKSRAVESHFGSVLDMTQASIKDWQLIPGIGKIIATRVYGSIRNNGKTT